MVAKWVKFQARRRGPRWSSKRVVGLYCVPLNRAGGAMSVEELQEALQDLQSSHHLNSSTRESLGSLSEDLAQRGVMCRLDLLRVQSRRDVRVSE